MTSQPSFPRLVITTAALLLLTGMAFGAPAEAGPARMIKDINQESVPVDLYLLGPQGNRLEFAQVGSVTFFAAAASDPDLRVRSQGTELWKITGTGATPELVADINPGGPYVLGPDSSDPSSLTAFGGALFFTADDGVHGRELWKSDGTMAGTMLVKDISFGSESGFSYTSQIFPAFGDTLFFFASDGDYGGLWKSDGTKEGTVLLKNILSGAGPSNTPGFTEVGGTLFFAADDGTVSGLWKSDGTGEGTVLVKAIALRDLAAINGTLFFRGSDGTVSGLWKSDGTEAGTVPVKEVGGPSPHFIAVGDTLFFAGNNVGAFLYELWKSDGTEAGTVPVKDINDETVVLFLFPPVDVPFFAAVNDTLFFPRGWPPTLFNHALWKTDGTPDGTREVTSPGLFSPPFTAGNYVFFAGSDAIHGRELWKSDGTDAGTMLVKDINPGAESGVGFGTFREDRPIAVGDDVVFWADDGVHGRRLWRSDATEEGTVPVKTVGFLEELSFISYLTAVGDSVFFAAYDESGFELWKSDGTEEGTILVKDIYPGECAPGFPCGGIYSHPAYPPLLTAVNDTLFFVAVNPVTGLELWKSDGTEEGTVKVKEGRPSFLAAVGDTLFFEYGGLWKSDGTEEGTVEVKDLRSHHYFDPFYDKAVAAGDTLFWTWRYPGSVSGLWKSDGTEEGTVEVIEPAAPQEPASFSQLTAINDSVFFSVLFNVAGVTQLWRSDGTPEGTISLNNSLLREWNASEIVSFAALDDTLFFRSSDPIRGPELWKSDGTVEGTVPVKAVNSGSHTAALDNLFFVHWTGQERELWKSDGTEEGTVPVKAIELIRVYGCPPYAPDASIGETCRDASPPLLTGDMRGLLFAADGYGAGIEPWSSNGEDSGTRQVQDIAPGSFSSFPRDFTVAGSRAFFVADDGTHGAELWGGRTAILMRNPAAAARDLADEVRALGLGRGLETSLIAKLNQMERMLGDPEHHDSPAALHLVEAFMHEVMAQRGGAILNEDADNLLDFAEEIVELLSEGGEE